MTIYLRLFDTEDEALVVLETANLAKNGSIDTTKVDMFPLWEKKNGEITFPDGTKHIGLHDDTTKDPKWAINLALNECPKTLLQYQTFPETPRRTFTE